MKTYQLNNSKMFGDVADGVAIIINSETGLYYGLNRLGTKIYENLLNGASEESIADAAASLPGAPQETAERVRKFIANLAEKEILLAVVRESITPCLEYEDASEDGFMPEMREYGDAQEMLLADPIHEVNEDTGWAPDKKVRDNDSEAVKRKESKIAW